MTESMRSGAPATLLIVDDDEEDIYLTARAFREHADVMNFESVTSGQELFEKLPSLSGPIVILLDINLPKQNGFDILAMLKQHEQYSKIPVVMFTTSDSPTDIEKAYELGASSYVVKSVSATEMKTIAEKICGYWFELARLPGSLIS